MCNSSPKSVDLVKIWAKSHKIRKKNSQIRVKFLRILKNLPGRTAVLGVDTKCIALQYFK